jgi:predicted dehydrogenase
MGRNHARTIKGFEGVRISHIVDADLARADELARSFGDEATIVSEDLVGIDAETADAAIIASPSQYHEEQAHTLIDAGVHVLIEKPVAESAESALAIGEAARRMGVVALAGHIELFNPTIHSLRALLENERIREMSFERLSSTPAASRLYHDVVSDLMIHDIAIALHLLEQKGETFVEGNIEAAIARSDTIASPDPARASIRFGDVDAHFRASRAYPAGKVRRATVETDNRIFTADLLTRNLYATSANSAEFTPDGVLTEETSTRKYFPQESQQPLTLEQRAFLECMRGQMTSEVTGVSMKHASRVLLLTRSILDSVRTS